MSNLSSLNVKIDRDVKKQADSVANAMGMTLSTAINIFVRQMVNERAIPFRIQLDDGKAQRNAEYLVGLDTALKNIANGKVISFTMDELEAMENMTPTEAQAFVAEAQERQTV